MNRKKIVLIMLGVVILLAGLLVCGSFGAKVVRRIRLRQTAMAAYEKGDYAQAERLFHQYIRLDPENEAVFVALANIYREFGNVEMEAQMWQTASSLNQQNPDYRANMLNSAVKSASYSLLHGILGRKARANEPFSDQELYLYVISSYRSGYPKDGENTSKQYAALDPEAFHRDDLGRMAEFMSTYTGQSDGDRNLYLSGAMRSEDPEIRFEALYFALRRLEQFGGDDRGDDEERERLLNQTVEANYFVGTALLADFYFSRYRFAEVIDVLTPYLKTIDDFDLYLEYAESFVFTCRTDELRALEEKLRQKTGLLPLLANYCKILIAYLEDDPEKLAAAFRNYGKRVDTALSRFIRLRVAMENDSFNEIRTAAQEIFSNPPFHDLHNRAVFLCLDYIAKEMKKPENQKDPSRMADLAKIMANYLHGNKMLSEIILMDQYKRGLVKEEYLKAAMDYFPDDALLQRISAEYLIFHGKAEESLPIIEHMMSAEKTAGQQPDFGVKMLLMLALDQTEQHDEAATVFRELAERSEFDLELMEQYFIFCVNNKRTADLVSMADMLDASENENQKQFGKFFRAAALLLSEDKLRESEALDLLASTPNDSPEFAFYAANILCRYDRLDEAEEKYRAIVNTYRIPSLPYVNLSIVYHAMGEDRKALEAAKTAFDLEKESMLPAFVYAKRLSEAGRYEDAVEALKFPRHAVDYREDIVALWCDCMHHVIENRIAGRKFLQAEEDCRYLLMIAPDDDFGKEKMEMLREILFPKQDKDKNGNESDESDPYQTPKT